MFTSKQVLQKTLIYILLSLFFVGGESCHLELIDPIKDGLIAAFEFEKSSDLTPSVVQFTNQSAEAETFEWDFGDGSDVVTEFSPTHTYSKEGEYIVTLRARNSDGLEDEFSLPIDFQNRTFETPEEITFLPYGAGSFDRILQTDDTTYSFFGATNYDPETQSQIDSVGVLMRLNSTGIPVDIQNYSNFSNYDISSLLLQVGYNLTIGMSGDYIVTSEFQGFPSVLFFNEFEAGYPIEIVVDDLSNEVLILAPFSETETNKFKLINLLNEFNSQTGCVPHDVTFLPDGNRAVLFSREISSSQHELSISIFDGNLEELSTELLAMTSEVGAWQLSAISNEQLAIVGSVNEDELIYYSFDRIISEVTTIALNRSLIIEDLEISPEGFLVVFGNEYDLSLNPNFPDCKIGLLGIDHFGNELFFKEYDSLVGGGREYYKGNDLIVTDDCGYLIVGEEYFQLGYLIPVAFKTDQLGNID